MTTGLENVEIYWERVTAEPYLTDSGRLYRESGGHKSGHEEWKIRLGVP
jgi:hypothetical protein